MSKDYYQILGVAPSAEDVVIRAAYRALAQRYHPDKTPHNLEQSSIRMRAIQEAYEVLGNPTRRARYDQGHKHLATFNNQAFGPDFDLSSSPIAQGNIEAQAWNILLRLYPQFSKDLSRLEKTQVQLAASYRTLLLELISEKLVSRIVNQLCHEMENVRTVEALNLDPIKPKENLSKYTN